MKFALGETSVASTSGLLLFTGMVFRYAPEHLAHSQKVAALARAMAERLNVADDDATDIERAALGHELGRIVVPDPPAGLPLDWTADKAVTAQQIAVAADLLATVPFLRHPAALVRAMGEHVDGSGGPRGLHGAAIPLGAKILAVADALEGMVAVCRDLGWPRDMAVAELVRHAGIRFDPDVTAAAVQVVDHAPLASGPHPPRANLSV